MAAGSRGVWLGIATLSPLVVAAACAEPGAPSAATTTDPARAPTSSRSAEPRAPSVASAPRASASARVPVDMQALVGRSLAEVVKALDLEERGFRYVDEPPGKLKVVRVEPEPAVELEIHLQYDSAVLFSEDRAWPLSRVGAARVLGLVRLRGSDRRVFGEIHTRLSRP